MWISVEKILPFVWRWRARFPDGAAKSGVRLSKAWAKAAARSAVRKRSRSRRRDPARSAPGRDG